MRSDICWACLVFLLSVISFAGIGVTLLCQRYGGVVGNTIRHSLTSLVSWLWDRRKWALVVVACAFVYQLLFRYEYVGYQEYIPGGLRGFGGESGFSLSGVKRVDRLTGDVCVMPCEPLWAETSRHAKSAVVTLGSWISDLGEQVSVPPEARENEDQRIYFTVLENGHKTITSGPLQRMHVNDNQTSATLDYELEPGELSFERLVGLRIVRNGLTAFDGVLPSEINETLATPVYDAKTNEIIGQTLDNDTLQIVDLAHDGVPEVLITTFSGGAHCCFDSTIYGFDPQIKKLKVLTQSWMDVMPKLAHLGHGRALAFVGAETSFRYKFSSFAGSGFPIRIWRYRPVRLDNVTRCYPYLIRADANHWWNLAHSQHGPYGEATGFLAAYAADMYMLGEGDASLADIRESGMRGVDETYLFNLRTSLKGAGYENGGQPQTDC